MAKKTTKAKAETKPRQHGSKHVMTLGDAESSARYEAASADESIYRLTYSDAVNMFALIHPDFLGVKEHWIKIGEDTTKVVCGVHETGEDQKIFSRWGYPEGCELCALASRLFDEAPKDSKDAMDIKKRKIARDIKANLSYYLFAVKGEGDAKRVKGKRILEPYFENRIVRKLVLSQAAFKTFYDAFKDSDFTPADVPGLPVNFVGGKNEGGFSQIQSIEFYPKFRINEIPDVPIHFGGLDVCDLNVIAKIAKAWSAELPKLLAGSRKDSTGKGAGKRNR